jgi:integrase
VELDHVGAFVAIVRRGGFTRAAAALHLSQPAISRLHLLEHELRALLFDRIRSGAALTDAGRAFLPHAEALLASREDGIEAVSASLLLQNGESPASVKEQMGHSSIQVTVDVYGHLIPGANRQAVDRLDDATGRNPRRESGSDQVVETPNPRNRL